MDLLLLVLSSLLLLLLLADIVKVLLLGFSLLLLLGPVFSHLLLEVGPLLLLNLGHARLKHLLKDFFVFGSLLVELFLLDGESLSLLLDKLSDTLRLVKCLLFLLIVVL